MRFLEFSFLRRIKEQEFDFRPKEQGESGLGIDSNPDKKALDNGWWEEIAFLSLSWILLASVVVLLQCTNHMPLASWKFVIKPNAALAILTTTARAALLVPVVTCIGQLKWLYFREPKVLQHLDLFDGTGPGLWGAFRLLLGLRSLGSVAILTWVAALVVILSLGIAPSTQQALTFVNGITAQNSTNASINLANGFGINIIPRIDPSSNLAAIDLGSQSSQEEILPLHGATLSAIHNLGASLNFTCETTPEDLSRQLPSSCRWPDFVSLGVCSSCSDVSLKTTESCSTVQCAANTSATSPFPCNVATHLTKIPQARTVTTCEITSPSNGTINWSRISLQDPDCSKSSSAQMSTMCSVLTLLNTTTTWGGKPFPENINDYITQASSEILTFVGLRVVGPNVLNVTRDVRECSLNWCGHRYVLPTHIGTQDMAYQIQPLPLINTTLDINKTNSFFNLTYFDDNKQTFPVKEKKVFDSSNLYGNHIFRVNAPAAWTLGGLLSDVLSQDLSNKEPPGNTDRLILGNMLYFHNTNWTAMMQNVASSLTSTLRNAPNNPVTYGQTLKTEPYTKFRWVWLIPTFVLVLLTTVLLLFTMILTKRYRVPVWKSWGLVYLFHGLEGFGKEELRVGSYCDIQQRSKAMVAQLRKNEDGDWQFSKSQL